MMPAKSLELWQTDDPLRPQTAAGTVMEVPAGWERLPPGDAGLTRRVKAAGPSWVIKAKRGRRTYSQGVWAPAQTIASIRADLARQRADPKYVAKLEAGRQRRAREQASYVRAFTDAVANFLAFAPAHRGLQDRLADAVAAHATPVGSGTVARTTRIDVAQRAEAATIAWLRHQTTGYDDMQIPRVKGMRRQVRRALAERSRRLLQRYRSGEAKGGRCPIAEALGPDSTDYDEAAALIELPL